MRGRLRPTLLKAMLLRSIPFSLHGAFELVLGAAVAVSPLAFDFGPAAILAAVFLGTTMIGLAVGAGTGEAGLSIATHAAYDRALAIGLVLAAGLMLVASEPSAVVTFAAAGLAQVALTVTTRYSADA